MNVTYERRKKNNDVRLKHNTKVPPLETTFYIVTWTMDRAQFNSMIQCM